MARIKSVGRVLGLLLAGTLLLPTVVGCRSSDTPVPPTLTSAPTSLSETSPLPTPQAETPKPESEPRGRVLLHRKGISGMINIYILEFSTGELTALTEGQGNNYDPALSPDGSQIAFISDRDRETTYGTLWMMGVDGSNQRGLLEPGGFFELGPTWSPEGQFLALQSNRDGNPEIMILDVESGELRNLTHHPSTDANPSWSPDGTRIAFASDRSGNPEIWIVDVDGTGLLRITDSPMAADWRPAWSPDGRELIYESSRVVYHRSLVVQDLDTGDTREVVTPFDLDYWPSWAYDDVILFAASEEYDENRQKPTPSHVYLKDTMTGELRQLTSGPGDDGRPTYGVREGGE